jgi:hypothetical protein
MAIWTAYYDASGKEHEVDKPLVIGAVVSTGEGWLQFEREWDDVLATYGMPYAHMSEVAQWSGPFAAWWKDRPDQKLRKDARRAAFVARLASVIERNVRVMLGLHMRPSSFHAVNREYVLARKWCPSPFPLLARMCSWSVEEWMSRHHPGESLIHLIEAGDDGEGALRRAVAAGLPDVRLYPTPAQDAATGKWVRQFEAADFLAYEHRLFAQRWYFDDDRYNPRTPGDDNLRRSFGALALGERSLMRRVRKEELLKMCRTLPDLFPPRVG